MTIEPHIAAGPEQQQQQQQQGADLGAIGDGVSLGADLVGAAVRNLPTGGTTQTGNIAGAATEAASGIADAADAGGGILEAIGGIFEGLSF